MTKDARRRRGPEDVYAEHGNADGRLGGAHRRDAAGGRMDATSAFIATHVRRLWRRNAAGYAAAWHDTQRAPPSAPVRANRKPELS